MCLEKTDDGTIVPMGLVKGLSLIGEPAVETLIEALKDKNSGVRRAATIALGEIGDARAVEPLAEALNDKDSEVRKWAAKALYKIFIHRIFKMLLSKNLITTRVMDLILSWRHSGFGVYCGKRIYPKEARSTENLARYIIRASFS